MVGGIMNSNHGDEEIMNNKKPPIEAVLNETTIKDVDGDNVWNFVGRFGRYQKWQMSLLFIVSISMTFPIFSGLFAGKNVKFECSSDDIDSNIPFNTTLDLSKCSKKIIETNTSRILSETQCENYQFEGNGTIISYLAEWNLVCEDETLGNLPQTVTMIGMGIGASTLTQLGDKFGRKKLIIGSLTSLSAVSLALAFVKQFEFFVVVKFLSGVLNQGYMVPMSVVMLELLTTEKRSMANLLFISFWVISSFVAGAIGYFMRDYDWRTMQIVFGALSASTLLFLCFIDESLRWLLGNTKVSDAEAIMKKACRWSNKDYQDLIEQELNSENGIGKPGSPHALLSPLDNSESHTTNQASDSSTVMTLLRNKNTRLISLVMCYTWMICSLSYYGLILLSTSLAGNSYLNFIIMAGVEWPAGILMVICIQKFGRNRTLVMFQLISAIFLMSSVLIACFAPPDNTLYSIMQTCLTMAGKFFVSGTFCGIWIYTPELYPTNFRNLGIGMSSASARIGATFSPFFTILARKALWAPGAMFATGCFLNVFLLNLLPETKGRELPKNIADIDAWIQDEKKNKRRNKNIFPKDDI